MNEIDTEILDYQSTLNKRTYSSKEFTNLLNQWIKYISKYIDYSSIKVEDVVLRETTLGTLVISKIIENDLEEFTIIDLAGDVFGGVLTDSQELLKENEYVVYKDKLQATKVLFNHNNEYQGCCPIKVANEIYSEYLL